MCSELHCLEFAPDAHRQTIVQSAHRHLLDGATLAGAGVFTQQNLPKGAFSVICNDCKASLLVQLPEKRARTIRHAFVTSAVEASPDATAEAAAPQPTSPWMATATAAEAIAAAAASESKPGVVAEAQGWRLHLSSLLDVGQGRAS